MYSYKDTDIAVVGMAGKFPGAANIDEYWANLKNGVESIRFFSDEELLEFGISKDLLHNKNYIKAKGYLKDTDCFDSQFFRYTLKEASVMNPQTRLFHEYVYAALEDAGYSKIDPDNNIGLFAGASCDDTWRKYINLHVNDNVASQFNNELLINKDFLCSSVAYKLGLKGPCIAINTACSTSLTAVHVACQAILNNECEMAIAGGVSITFPPKNGYIYEEGMLNSPNGHCYALDKNAQGTIEGNGIGVVVLKKLSAAIDDKDIIYAVVKGSAVNNDGNNKLNFTAPSLSGIESVIREAYKKSGVDLKMVKYIEMHGTGTPLGDAVEIAALKSVFAEQNNTECIIGSVKANIGHLDAASGIASFIKTVLILHHNQIPPAINFTLPNDELITENKIFSVNTDLIDLCNGVQVYAGVNSFGQGGSNVHIILENFNDTTVTENNDDVSLMLFSAKTKQSLQNYMETFFEYINNKSEKSLSDISYTLAMIKNHYKYRAYWVARKQNEFKKENIEIRAVEKNKHPKIAVICDGNTLINNEKIKWFYHKYSSFASYINSHGDINNIINYDSTKSFDKALILSGLLSLLINTTDIKIDYLVGYGIGIIALMNTFSNMSFEGQSTFCRKKEIIKFDYPIYDPKVNRFVEKIKMNSIEECYKMDTAPECKDLFDGNMLFIHLNTTDLLYVSQNYNGDKNKEINNQTLEAIIGELWLNGISLDISKAFTNKEYKKTHLPSYSFDKIEHKLEKSLPVGKERRVETYYYRSEWIFDKNVCPTINKVDDVLIFVCSKYASKTSEYFKSLGCNYIIAEAGEVLKKSDDNYFVFNPEEQSHYDYIFYNIMKQDLKIKYVINLLPLSLSMNFNELINEDKLNINLLRLRSIVLGISKYECDTDIIICNVTEKLYSLANPSEANFSFAGLSGLQEVISKEYMNITCINVDFDSINDTDDRIFNCIINEISNEEIEKTVVYEQNYRFLPKTNSLKKNDEKKTRLNNGDVYIILGGTGRIGKIVADFISQQTNCTIIISGLSKIFCSGLVDIMDERSIESVDLDLYHKLKKIAQKGSKIYLGKVNILDKNETSEFFDNVFQKFGKINGIVNCIGATDQRFNQLIENIKIAEIEQQLKIRETGLIALDFILDTYDYDFCILFSSIVSILGGLGQFAYAGACSFMDRYVATRNSIKKTKWEVINMDTWVTESEYDRAYHLVPHDIAFDMLNYIFQNKFVFEYMITFKDIQHYINNNQSMIDKYHENGGVDPKKKVLDVLSAIWKDVFGREVATSESFFDIGGDSLKALEIISNLHNQLNVRLKIKDLYRCQTIDKLVSQIENTSTNNMVESRQTHIDQQQEYYECSFSQQEMLQLKNNIYPTRYNLSCVFSIDGVLDLDRINMALNKLVKRHEIYRTCFIVYNGEYHQKIEDDVNLKIEHVYSDDIDAEIEKFIVDFEVTKLPLLKMQLVTDMKRGKHYLFTDMHHAIFDDQSIQMFFNELLTLYSGDVVDDNVKQFKEYSCAQHQAYYSGAYLSYQEYWLRKMNGFRYTELIPDRNSSIDNFKKTNFILINKEQYSFATQFAANKNMSLSSLILSAWMLVLSYFSSQNQVSAGLRVTNRMSEFKRTMGCFLEKIILIIEINERISLGEYLILFEAEYNKTLENSFYPFYLLTQEYKQDKLFSILFNYMIIDNNPISNGDITLIPYKYEPKILNSKYTFNFRIFDDKSKVSCSLKYKDSLYSDKYTQRMFALFRMIIDNMLDNTEITIENIFKKQEMVEYD